jgi:hypothetical protein
MLHEGSDIPIGAEGTVYAINPLNTLWVDFSQNLGLDIPQRFDSRSG